VIDLADSLCHEILARIEATPARAATKLVAIDGRGGSGKTRLAEELMAIDGSIKRLSLDHFPCRADEYPFHPSGVQTRISKPRVLMTLLPLTQGVAASYRRTHWWHTDPDGSIVHVQPGGTVLVDGCYALLPEFRPLLDFSVWIDCAPDVALTRAIARENVGAAGRTAWVTAHGPAQERYIAAHRPAEFADLVLVVDADGRLRHADT
jgi:uridine kinase